MVEPPTYSQRDGPPDRGDPQILIVPSNESINFQKGYLGAEDERAAIEGELQIKGALPDEWSKLTLSLTSLESSFHHHIELGSSQITLFSGQISWPSSFPFAIPLMPDTPQSLQTPYSSLSHTLTAVLEPVDSNRSPLTKSVQVFTRRYTSHADTIPLSPQTFVYEDPTRMEIQVPRINFKADEAIPVYVTIPPPRTELVVDEGVRLRNIRAELVRVIEVNTNADQDSDSETEGPANPAIPVSSAEASSSSAPLADSAKPMHTVSLAHATKSPLLLGSSYRRVVSKSGASCRFHASRPVQLRFLLNQPSQPSTPPETSREYSSTESDADSSAITQSTLLHSVSFHVNVLVSFVDIASRRERISTIRIPIQILPPSAPLPEVASSLDAEYRKKHDRPPLRTVRLDDPEASVPGYSEGQAGPSAIPYGAPPPFEERDAPPPFFSPQESSTSASGLPSFLESEREIIVANDHAQAEIQHVPSSPIIQGEGFEFGFPSTQQFDGHSQEMERSSTPPPSLEMAGRDTDLTSLADMQEPERAIEALGLVLEQHQENTGTTELPPPPPPMDDPSDPPPAIDFQFAAAGDSHGQQIQDRPATPPPPHDAYEAISPPESYDVVREPNSVPVPAQPPTNLPAANEDTAPHANAPPPYLGDHAPNHHGVADNDHDHVTRPPPYMD